MRVISVRNVQCALPEGIRLLRETGELRESRNGDVLVSPEPVTTVFQRPEERVLFWPQRDANPFFHLYESLWMLAGRNDVRPLSRYAKQMLQYTDDGETLHGAYGYRWRRHFEIDQLSFIIRQLKKDATDRRCVLQMWDADHDLGRDSKDLPCNLMVTFQINKHGLLDMSVFNRSNDIIWGLYGANAVHFSMLHDYMACSIGVPMGTYTHVSVNFHAYLSVLNKMLPIPTDDGYGRYRCAYELNNVHPVNFIGSYLDDHIAGVLEQYPFGNIGLKGLPHFARVALIMFHAHFIATDVDQKDLPRAIAFLEEQVNVHANPDADWIVAGLQWLHRRLDRQVLRAAKDGETLSEA